ncbi:MAG: type II toxin-antitoxin system HicB family antitoxin [Deltaproteobacteria bacterium]|jgi:predicted HicB family RNase H-like nuclease|nr:type II toxin-antitoxin system HicB family antitoxin [Deltaproteobacteria bacterium]
MKNTMQFYGGYKAVITYNQEIGMFRGEFVGLNGGADFYAKDTEGLQREGQTSLKVFLRMCEEDGVSPKKPQGKFALRLDPETYYDASVAAAAHGLSLNQWITKAVQEAARD